MALTSTYGKDVSHEEFCEKYLTDSPCYVCVDFDYETRDGRPSDKIVLISWIPDTAKVRQKMTFAGTKEAVKSALQGIGLNINATDKSECTKEVIVAECNKI